MTSKRTWSGCGCDISTMSAFTVCRPNASIACGSMATRVPLDVSMTKNDCPYHRNFGSLGVCERVEPQRIQRTPREDKKRVFISDSNPQSVFQKPFHERPAGVEAQIAG